MAPDVGTDDVVCLYLRRRDGSGDPTDAPTAEEVGDALELGTTTADRVRLLGVLDDLVEEGLVAARQVAVAGHGSRTAYELTEAGRRHARELRARLADREVLVTDEGDGPEERASLSAVGEFLDAGAPMATALARLTDDGRVPLDRYVGEEFVDREKPLAAVEEGIESSLTGAGRPTLVAGESGMGKTALVETALDGLAGDFDVTVARAACRRGPADAYAPLRRALADRPEPTDVGVEVLAPLDDAPGEATLDAGGTGRVAARRRSLFDDVADELRGAVEAPLVVFLDDLQWADESTLALFEHLATTVTEWVYPVAFVGAYRPGPVAAGESALAGTVDRLAEAGAVTVELAPLDRSDTRTLLAGTLGRRRLPEGFVAAVQRRTGGVPLFVRETGAHLLETGAVDPDAGEFPEDAGDVGLPATVTDTVADRLAALDDTARRLVRLGAVVGEAVPTAVLAAASDLPDPEFREYVAALEAGRVWERRSVRPDGAGDPGPVDGGVGDADLAVPGAEDRDGGGDGDEDAVVRFVGGGLREAVVEDLPPEAAERLHGVVAGAMESVYGDDIGPHAAALAGHHERAGNRDRAVELYRRAGDRARQRYANEAAVGNYRRALSLLGVELAPDRPPTDGDVGDDVDPPDDTASVADRDGTDAGDGPDDGDARRACELLDATADAQHALSRYEAARATAERYRALADRVGDDDHRARALVHLGETAYERGEYDRARKCFDESLELRRAADDRRGIARSLDGLGRVATERGEYDRASDDLGEALSIYRELGVRHGAADCLKHLGTVASERGAYDRATDHYREALSLYRAVGAREAAADCLKNRGIVAMRDGDQGRAAEYFEESLSINREVGDRHGAAECLNNLGAIAYRRGDGDRAREYFEESLSIDRGIGARASVASDLNNLGAIAQDRGNYERAAEYFEESLSITRDIGRRRKVTHGLHNLGKVAHELGDNETARERFEESRSVARELGYTALVANNAYALGRVARERGEYATAREELTEALESTPGGVGAPTVVACRAELAATQFELADAGADADPDLETATATGEAAVAGLEDGDVPEVGTDSTLSLRALVEAAADRRAERAADWCERVLDAVSGDLDDGDREWFVERSERLRSDDDDATTSE